MNTEQILSDQKFYTKQLQERAAKILGLDPENTSWAEIVGTLESMHSVIVQVPDDLDPRNCTLVADTAEKMAVKLRAAEIKYGYGASWLESNWEAKCRSDLMFHIDKGDPTDVAIYAAFMMHHGWSTTPKLVGR